MVAPRIPLPFAAVRAVPARRGAMRGMSLLEMVLVLALVAALALMAAMAMSGGMDGMRLRSAGKSLAAELRYTRTRAISTGVVQQLQINPGSRRWQGADGHHGELPQALTVSFTGAGQLQTRRDEGVIRFFEDGVSSGGRIELRAGAAVWRIDVAWITGEVKAGPLREGAG